MGLVTLAIDPGLADPGNGCARFDGVTLVRAYFHRLPRKSWALPEGETRDVRRVVIERPAYQGKRSDGAHAGDLMGLAWEGALLAGAYAGRDGAAIYELPAADVPDKACMRHGTRGLLARRVLLTPAPACTCERGWKGSEPKPIHHARVWEELTLAERRVLGGDKTHAAIERACEKGALNRWGRPGASYYPRAFKTHNLLDAAALGLTFLGRIERVG